MPLDAPSLFADLRFDLTAKATAFGFHTLAVLAREFLHGVRTPATGWRPRAELSDVTFMLTSIALTFGARGISLGAFALAPFAA